MLWLNRAGGQCAHAQQWEALHQPQHYWSMPPPPYSHPLGLSEHLPQQTHEASASAQVRQEHPWSDEKLSFLAKRDESDSLADVSPTLWGKSGMLYWRFGVKLLAHVELDWAPTGDESMPLTNTAFGSTLSLFFVLVVSFSATLPNYKLISHRPCWNCLF